MNRSHREPAFGVLPVLMIAGSPIVWLRGFQGVSGRRERWLPKPSPPRCESPTPPGGFFVFPAYFFFAKIKPRQGILAAERLVSVSWLFGLGLAELV